MAIKYYAIHTWRKIMYTLQHHWIQALLLICASILALVSSTLIFRDILIYLDPLSMYVRMKIFSIFIIILLGIINDNSEKQTQKQNISNLLGNNRLLRFSFQKSRELLIGTVLWIILFTISIIPIAESGNWTSIIFSLVSITLITSTSVLVLIALKQIRNFQILIVLTFINCLEIVTYFMSYHILIFWTLEFVSLFTFIYLYDELKDKTLLKHKSKSIQISASQIRNTTLGPIYFLRTNKVYEILLFPLLLIVGIEALKIYGGNNLVYNNIIEIYNVWSLLIITTSAVVGLTFGRLLTKYKQYFSIVRGDKYKFILMYIIFAFLITYAVLITTSIVIYECFDLMLMNVWQVAIETLIVIAMSFYISLLFYTSTTTDDFFGVVTVTTLWYVLKQIIVMKISNEYFTIVVFILIFIVLIFGVVQEIKLPLFINKEK